MLTEARKKEKKKGQRTRDGNLLSSTKVKFVDILFAFTRQFRLYLLYHPERRIRPHEVRTVLPSDKAETASASAHEGKVDRHTGSLNVVTEG